MYVQKKLYIQSIDQKEIRLCLKKRANFGKL